MPAVWKLILAGSTLWNHYTISAYKSSLIENIFSVEGEIRAEISCLEKVWICQKHMVLVSSGLLTKYSLFGGIKLASSRDSKMGILGQTTTFLPLITNPIINLSIINLTLINLLKDALV